VLVSTPQSTVSSSMTAPRAAFNKFMSFASGFSPS
jgi:hypothetical protein